MDEINTFINNQDFVKEAIGPVFFRLVICALLLTLISYFYKKYSITLGAKSHFSYVLPLVGLIVFLIIIIVKSSLALSLGLVGALSIVRFRTPIKEPEELGYLFLAIAVGLGFGAGYELITIVSTLFILTYLYLIKFKNKKDNFDGDYVLVITIPAKNDFNIFEFLEPYFLSLKLNRAEINEDKKIYFFGIVFKKKIQFNQFISDLKAKDPNISVNMVENTINW